MASRIQLLSTLEEFVRRSDEDIRLRVNDHNEVYEFQAYERRHADGRIEAIYFTDEIGGINIDDWDITIVLRDSSNVHTEFVESIELVESEPTQSEQPLIEEDYIVC